MEAIITKLNREIKSLALKAGKKVNIGKFNPKTGNMKVEFYDDCVTDNVDVSALDKSRFDSADKIFDLRKLGIDLGKKFLSIEKKGSSKLKEFAEMEIVGANPNAKVKVIEVIRDNTGKRKFMSISDVQYLLTCKLSVQDLWIENGTHEYDENGNCVALPVLSEWEQLYGTEVKDV